MRVLSSILVILSSLLLGAHFLRGGETVLMVGSLAIPALLFVRAPWGAWAVRLLLLAGAVEWLWTMYVSASMRSAMGQPAGRLIVILCSVAVFTAVAAALVRPRLAR